MKDSRRYLICLLLSVITIAVYWQVLHFDFTNFDDPKYVTENPNVQRGLTRDSISWAFTTTHANNWHPLTWLSLMLDRHLFGSSPRMFHLMNLLLHIANTVLLFIVLSRCTAAVWPSTFVAAAFALHPLHVESVAWIAERKDVLSTLFWMLTMLAYTRYAERPGVSRYMAVVAAFALGLMAKPMLVTLPCVLLLLDYWPLRRTKPTQSAGNNSPEGHGPLGTGNRKALFSLVLEKIPFFILAAASATATFIAQKGAIQPVELLSLKARITNSLVSYASYIAKMFWPKGLAVFYPHLGDTLPIWQIAVAFVVLSCASAWVILCGRRRRYLIVGWLWYIGTLVPVIGVIQTGAQAMADRYTYIPLTGLLIIIAWYVPDLASQYRYRRIIIFFLAFVWCVALMTCSYIQVGYWRSSIMLFKRALSVTSNNLVAHNNLGTALAKEGNVEQAIDHFKAALRIEPNDIDARSNLAENLAEQGRLDEAMQHYSKLVHLDPRRAETYNSLGLVMAEQGYLEKAIVVYRSGLESNPQDVPLHSNLGAALLHIGQIEEAISEFQTALETSPESKTYINMGIALALKGKFDEAVKHYGEAIKLDPQSAKAHFNLGNAFLAQSKLSEAAAGYRRAISIKPDYAKALSNLAVALSQQGKLDEAIYYFTEAVRVEPGDVEVRCNLADALLEKGQIEKSAKEYREVLKIEPGHPRAHRGLKDIEERKTSADSP